MASKSLIDKDDYEPANGVYLGLQILGRTRAKPGKLGGVYVVDYNGTEMPVSSLPTEAFELKQQNNGRRSGRG